MTTSETKSFRAEYVSWPRMAVMARRLALLVSAAGFRPDTIIAIARGGFVPARILCDYLGVNELAGMRIAHYQAGAAMEKRARLTAPVNVSIAGKKVLLVDDLIDTGGTFQVALAHLRDLQPRELKSAVLLVKPGADAKADFVARRLLTWRWVVYPWAAVEDIGAFVKQKKMPRQPEQMRARLAAELGLAIPRRLAGDIARTISEE